MAGKGSSGSGSGSGVGGGRVTRRNLLGLPRHQLIAQEKRQQLQQQRQQYQNQQQQRRLTRSPSPLPLPLPLPPPPPDTTDSLNVFVNYDGRWDDEGCYVDFKMTGILVSMNTTYHGLLELLFKELKMKPSEHTITVQYQVIKGSPPITIVSDSGVLFYLELKKKDPVLTGFPLCIVVENKPMTTMIERLVEKNNHPLPINYVQTSEQLNETIYRDEQDQSNHLNVLPSATNSDRWQVQSGQDREDGYGELQPYKKRQRRYAVGENELAHTVISEYQYTEIAVKQLYKNKDVLKKVVSLFAIRNKFQFRVRRSDKRFFMATCMDKNCKWLLRASKFLRTDLFIVRKYVPTHTCPLDRIEGDHRQASSQVIGECIKSKCLLLGEKTYTPQDIIRDMKDEYGVSISYEKAWRARECALDMIRGTPEESYENVLSYLYMLKNKNPGSVTHLGTDGSNRFQYLFMALGASIRGWPHCRPVIVVHETFLKAKQNRTLFTACAKDANDRIFPLAFGISDFDNDTSWDWFFTKLKEAYGDRDGLCIISDQQSNISEAVQKVYPSATHGFCMNHLLNNLKTQFKSCAREIIPAFIAAARSYGKEDFEYYMKQLDNVDVGIRAYLAEAGNEKWSRAFFSAGRYSMMTANITESLNIDDAKTREMPVATLVEWLTRWLHKWFTEKRSEAESTVTVLAAATEKVLRDNQVASLPLSVVPIDSNISRVFDGDNLFIVNLQDKTCSCRRFDLDQIPCRHALAVISKKRLSAYAFCSHYYKKDELLASYQETICPLGNPRSWSIPDEVKAIEVLPPVSAGKSAGPGRPKRKSMSVAGEEIFQIRCGRCGECGHNRKTCKNPPAPRASRAKSKGKSGDNTSICAADDGKSEENTSVCIVDAGKPGENTSVCVADAGKSGENTSVCVADAGKSGENTSVCVADAGKSGENTSVCVADAGKSGDNTSVCVADEGKSGDNTSICIADEGKSGDNTSICIADEGKSGDNTSVGTADGLPSA